MRTVYTEDSIPKLGFCQRTHRPFWFFMKEWRDECCNWTDSLAGILEHEEIAPAKRKELKQTLRKAESSYLCACDFMNGISDAVDIPMARWFQKHKARIPKDAREWAEKYAPKLRELA